MSDKFRPSWTSFPFSIVAPDVTLSLTLPKWSTHRLQTMEPITKLMTVGLLRLDGSYLYFSDVREENVDQLRLNITVRVFPRLDFSPLCSSCGICSSMTLYSSVWHGPYDIS